MEDETTQIEPYTPQSNALWRYDRIQELAQAILDTDDGVMIKEWAREMHSLT